MPTVGVDVGLSGAMVLYDKDMDFIIVDDMPTYATTVNKKKRHRVDDVMLLQWFEQVKKMGADRVVIEQLWERPGDRGMFVMGLCAGLVRMACIANKLPIDEVPPQTWKKLLRVPGKLNDSDEVIVRRADELLPTHCDKWRGPKGGRLVDRAEAAMLAYYGEQYLVGR